MALSRQYLKVQQRLRGFLGCASVGKVRIGAVKKVSRRLVAALRHSAVLPPPIIADRTTGIVLDRTHRFAAIKQLKCNFIPSALVDYNDPQITIERWFRLFSGSNLRNLEIDLRLLKPKDVNHDECEDGLSKRRWYA